MARGWDSKSVEAQIESAESARHKPNHQDRPPADIEALREKEGLEMSRTRILHEIDTCLNPRYRVILGKALADLDQRLATFSLRRAAHSG